MIEPRENPGPSDPRPGGPFAPPLAPAPSTRTDAPRLTAIIVNYESWPDVDRLTERLTAEPECRSGDCRVIVVDNASSGPMPDRFARPTPGLELIVCSENLGFAAGVNVGWRAARGRWLLVLNPDVEVAPGFLRRTFARLDHYEAMPGGPPGIVGFGLRNADGSPQGSVGAFPSLARSFWEQFLPRSVRKYRPARRARPGPVDWVTGACMLVNTAMMNELGGMDEGFFLYHEEVAFSRVAHDRGWRVEHDPSVCAVHRCPLQNRAISPKMRVIIRHSKLLYFHKHLPHWQFWTLSAIVSMESAVRWRWCWLCRRAEDERGWRAVAGLARRLRRGDRPSGPEVRDLAESVAQPVAGASASLAGPWRRRRPANRRSSPERRPVSTGR